MKNSPYLSETRTACKYACDFTADDHRKLSRMLARFKRTKVLVSYYDTPLLLEYYPDWKRVPLSAPRTMKHTTGGPQERVEAGEVLLINRD